jgi:hypothetical protein
LVKKDLLLLTEPQMEGGFQISITEAARLVTEAEFGTRYIRLRGGGSNLDTRSIAGHIEIGPAVF